MEEELRTVHMEDTEDDMNKWMIQEEGEERR
jgi:hypothetical protein